MSKSKAIFVLLVSLGLLLAFIYAIFWAPGRGYEGRLYCGVVGATGYIAFIAYQWWRGNID